MKILRSDHHPGGLRVVEKIAWWPMLIRTTCSPDIFIWPGTKYYVLQRLSYWYLWWMDEEKSINPNEWDFKWSDAYLNLWK